MLLHELLMRLWWLSGAAWWSQSLPVKTLIELKSNVPEFPPFHLTFSFLSSYSLFRNKIFFLWILINFLQNGWIYSILWCSWLNLGTFNICKPIRMTTFRQIIYKVFSLSNFQQWMSKFRQPSWLFVLCCESCAKLSNSSNREWTVKINNVSYAEDYEFITNIPPH